jgi:hypothetical protein
MYRCVVDQKRKSQGGELSFSMRHNRDMTCLDCVWLNPVFRQSRHGKLNSLPWLFPVFNLKRIWPILKSPSITICLSDWPIRWLLLIVANSQSTVCIYFAPCPSWIYCDVLAILPDEKCRFKTNKMRIYRTFESALSGQDMVLQLIIWCSLNMFNLGDIDE